MLRVASITSRRLRNLLTCRASAGVANKALRGKANGPFVYRGLLGLLGLTSPSRLEVEYQILFFQGMRNIRIYPYQNVFLRREGKVDCKVPPVRPKKSQNYIKMGL